MLSLSWLEQSVNCHWAGQRLNAWCLCKSAAHTDLGYHHAIVHCRLVPQLYCSPNGTALKLGEHVLLLPFAYTLSDRPPLMRL